jgi:phosphate transport system substrate-binding protein
MMRLKHRVSSLIFGGLLILLLASCVETPQVTRTPVRLRLGDSSDQAALLNQLIETYTPTHDWLSFTFDSLSTQDAINRVRDGQLDLAVIPSSDQSTGSLWRSGFAYETIVVIVHPDNPAGELSLAQLRDLFQGKTFDWTPFGGSGDVVPVSREATAPARILFEERVMNNRAVTLNAVLEPSAQAVVDFVSRNPGAIGYVSASEVNSGVKMLKIEGVLPSPEVAATQQYLLSAPLYLIARSEPTGDLREFVAWLLGSEGQGLISQAGLGQVH